MLIRFLYGSEGRNGLPGRAHNIDKWLYGTGDDLEREYLSLSDARMAPTPMIGRWKRFKYCFGMR